MSGALWVPQWSARHGAYRVNESRGTFSLHSTADAANAYVMARGCTSDDPTNHQGDTCPLHESGRAS